jgi:hypothetical protein
MTEVCRTHICAKGGVRFFGRCYTADCAEVSAIISASECSNCVYVAMFYLQRDGYAICCYLGRTPTVRYKRGTLYFTKSYFFSVTFCFELCFGWGGGGGWEEVKFQVGVKWRAESTCVLFLYRRTKYLT